MKRLWFWIMLCCNLAASAQDVAKVSTDRLTRQFTQKLQLADSLFKKHAHEQALGTMRVLLTSLQNQNRPDLSAKAQVRLGLMLQEQAHYEASLAEFRRGLMLYRQTNDSLGVAWCLSCLGNSYQTLKSYEQALTCHLQALKIREANRTQENPIRFSNTYKNLGHVYLDLGDEATAERFFLQSLQLKEAIPDSVGIAGIFTSLGELHFHRKHFEQALVYYLKGAKILEKSEPTILLPTTYGFVAKAYAAMGDYAKGDEYYKTAIETLQRLQLKNRGTALYLAWGEMYAQWGKPQQAIITLKKALLLAQSTHNAAREAEIFDALASQYNQVGNNAEAFDNLQHSKMIRDSLYQAESAKKLAEMRARFETEQKEKEIQRLNEANRQSLLIRNWLIIALVTFLILSGITIYLIQKRRQAYAELKVEKDKTEDLLTEKERLHNELQQTQIQLISQDKMASLGLMMAGIAHEMNNPLNYVANNVQALKLDIQDLDVVLQQLEQPKTDATPIIINGTDLPFLREEINSLISSIERGTERTVSLVNSLRNFVRNDSDKFTQTNIEEGMDSALTVLHNTYKNYAIVQKHFGGIQSIMTISGKLNQVFLNIIYNAVQAIKTVHAESETPTGIIEIKTEQVANKVRISITDNGCGMDEKTQKRIFEPFFTTKPVGDGTGLGLSISYGIIEQHHGTINVSSNVGKGTTFVIELPIS